MARNRLEKQGKDVVFKAGLVLCVCAFVCLVVAFCTPYWVISWPRVFNQFKRVGLWQACFAGLVLEMDPTQKAYHGCWWILAKEFYEIRDWLMPPWFVVTQVLVTLCVVAEGITLIVQLILYQKSQRVDATGYTRKLPPFNLVQATTYVTVIMGIVKSLVAIMFAVCFYKVRNWMPRPDLNYPSFSYGMFIMSAFFSIFASIAHVTYNRIIRQESREAPRIPINPTHFGGSISGSRALHPSSSS